MVQINLLKGVIKENNETLEDYAKVIGKSVTTIQDRFNLKKQFTIEEAFRTKKYYNLSDERFLDIFFKEETT